MRTIAEINSEISKAREQGLDWEVIKPLIDERSAAIKKNRNDYEDGHYSILIDCPEHLTHKATLYVVGHRYAGIWECRTTSDVCPHFDTVKEEDEDEDGERVIYNVCVLDGTAVIDNE